MATAPTAKAGGARPGQDAAGHLRPLAERYGLTIENDWVEELEPTYGVKL
jgi:hypothetical protein